MTGFDSVDELSRFALGGDEIVPATRAHQFFGKAEDAIGDGVAVVVIVEEPGVNVTLAKRVLNGGEVHRYWGILHEELRRPVPRRPTFSLTG